MVTETHTGTMSNQTRISLSQRLEMHTDVNGVARLHALKNTVSLANLIPPTVSYESAGRAVVVGGAKSLSGFAGKIPDAYLERVVFLCLDSEVVDPAFSSHTYYAKQADVDGFLGAFLVAITAQPSVSQINENLAKIALGTTHFDLVVDLTEDGLHGAQLPPLGYYAVGRALCHERDALEALAEMTGTFDKPKFFKLDTDRCAHARSGLSGCTRCIDACPADALNVVDKKIAINPYLCQGMGSCATACPTEAISYALPEPDTTQHFVFDVLNRYREQGGDKPVVLFYADTDETALAAVLDTLPSRVIPLRLEELASVGAETWLSAIVYGAAQVVLAKTESLHQKTRTVLESEVGLVTSLLGSLSLASSRLSLVDISALPHFTFLSDAVVTHQEKLSGSKRDKLCAALDALADELVSDAEVVAVPTGAPYGTVSVSTSGCTLCMSCASVCPTAAIKTIGDRPGLTFREQDCVQCGLCEAACPEKVITLTPRFNWDAATRRARTVIHEEAAAECISCGKPFAPASMVNMLIEKLRGHSHFQEDAIKRLSMCEDCRVRDIVTETMINDPEKQLKV